MNNVMITAGAAMIGAFLLSSAAGAQGTMDKIEGTAKEVTGTAKENVGKAIGDKKLESEGIIEKYEGAIQNSIGNLKNYIKSWF